MRVTCPNCGHEHTASKSRFVPKYIAMRDEMVAAYQAGASLAEVAKKYGVSTGPVVWALKSAGIKRRSKGSGRRQDSALAARNEQIAELYKSGLTLEEIGAQHGLTRERVRQILARRFSDIGRDHHPRSKAYRERVERERAEETVLAERLEADYRRLGTVDATAKAHGLAYHKVIAILHRHGVDIVSRPRAKPDRNAQLVHEYTTTDKTVEQLASEFGMPAPSLRARLHRLGWTETRRKAERAAQQEAAA